MPPAAASARGRWASSATARSMPCGARGPGAEARPRRRRGARGAGLGRAHRRRGDPARDGAARPRALGELPDEQSQVIGLAYFGGFTHSEIAEMLGMPLGTVRDECGSGWRRSARCWASGWASTAPRGTAVSRDWHADPERLGDELAAYALGALGPGEADRSSAIWASARNVASICSGCDPRIDVLPTSVDQLEPAGRPAGGPAGRSASRGAGAGKPRAGPGGGSLDAVGLWPAIGLAARRRARRRTGGRVPGQRRRPGARRRSGRGGAARRAAGPGLGDARAPRRLGDPARQRPAPPRSRRGLRGLGSARGRGRAGEHLRPRSRPDRRGGGAGPARGRRRRPGYRRAPSGQPSADLGAGPAGHPCRTPSSRYRPAPVATCYRHPGRETNVACSNCGRPICPDCMTSTPVGMRCPECAARPDHCPRPRRRRRALGCPGDLRPGRNLRRRVRRRAPHRGSIGDLGGDLAFDRLGAVRARGRRGGSRTGSSATRSCTRAYCTSPST